METFPCKVGQTENIHSQNGDCEDLNELRYRHMNKS